MALGWGRGATGPLFWNCLELLFAIDFNAFVELLVGRRNIVGWVEKAEVIRAESNLGHFRGHDREIFHAWVVSEPVCVPYDDILIADLLTAAAQPGLDTSATK